MHYSIGEVSDVTGIAASTLRYYDREGMFPAMERSSGGIRVFSDTELATLKVIECLKSSGMSIRDIKEFLGWCQEGDSSIGKRREMFHRRLAEVEAQIAGLERTRNMLRYKCAPATCCATSAGTTTPPPKPAPRTPCGTSPSRPFRRTCAITASKQGRAGGSGDILRSPTRPIHEARPQDPFHPTLPASPDSDAS